MLRGYCLHEDSGIVAPFYSKSSLQLFFVQKLPSRVEKSWKWVRRQADVFKVRFELPLRGINAVSTPTPRARLTVATFRSTVLHPIVGILFRDISFRDKVARESRFEEVIDMNHVQLQVNATLSLQNGFVLWWVGIIFFFIVLMKTLYLFTIIYLFSHPSRQIVCTN